VASLPRQVFSRASAADAKGIAIPILLICFFEKVENAAGARSRFSSRNKQALRWLAANPPYRKADDMRERLLANYPETEGADG